MAGRAWTRIFLEHERTLAYGSGKAVQRRGRVKTEFRMQRGLAKARVDGVDHLAFGIGSIVPALCGKRPGTIGGLHSCCLG